MTITISGVWNFAHTDNIPEPDGNDVSGDSNPTGSMLGAGPGERADDANSDRYERQQSDEDETPGNPNEESKDTSANAPIEAAESQGDQGGD